MSFSVPTPPPPDRSVFPILSLNRFGQLLGIPLAYLKQLADRAPAHYHTFWDKRGKEPRLIEEPSDTLKTVKRIINDILLCSVPLPKFVIGGVKGRKYQEHPELHVGQPVVATIDVKKCYPNVTERQIYAVWRRLGCSKRVASLATKLTVFRGHLPTGAPTSPALANHVLLPASHRAYALAQEQGLRLSQYIDDLAMSGPSIPDDVITSAIKEFVREKVKISRKKTKVMPRGNRQIVTKRLVNRRVALPLKERKNVRAALHELTKTSWDDTRYAERYHRVLGQISYLKAHHTAQGTRLMAKFTTLNKPEKSEPPQ
jgi:RNA-directed DNA polymerase